MNSLNSAVREARIQRVAVTEGTIVVGFIDGRRISAPLGWYPRLLHASSRERNNWRLIADGEGIHWPDLDEDLSVEGIILGRASGESQASLKCWLESREAAARQHRVPRSKSHRQPPRAGRHAAQRV